MKVLKGMKDVHFEEVEKFNFITNKAVEIFERYSYTRLITPILEELELFKRSVGDETDVVSKEMYDFVDKGGRNITLRPEATASAVRAYLDAKLYNTHVNTKWYYFGPMYRYEAPQKGRYREFNQAGVEAFGIRDPFQDASIIDMACKYLNSLGINEYTVEINSLANKESRKKYIEVLQKYLIDNFDKLSENSKKRCYKNPLRVLDSKEDDEIVKNAPLLHDFFDEESRLYFEKVKYYLDKFKIKYVVNTKLVRGLDYYCDTVFEIKTDKLGAKSTILSGGRYDGLISQLSNKDVPAIGFAAGIERLSLLIDKSYYENKKEKIFIAYFDDSLDYLFEVLEELKDVNAIIHYEYSPKNFSSQMKKANKIGANKVIILGENEMNTRTISIKDFDYSTQKTINFNELKGEFNV